MSGYAVLAWDGEDAGAYERRMGVRPRHLPVIHRWAEAGRLSLAMPLLREGGGFAGSLLVLAGEDEVGVKEYLAEEPFAREGVWVSYDALPFRLAALPYQPLPRSGPTPPEVTHCITIAEDGDDTQAPARRQAVRDPHMARVREAATAGILTLGGALVDRDGIMRGSLAVTRHPTLAEAEAFWAEDPYVTQGVWQRVRRFRSYVAPLPYHPLPVA
jgi:uncharacterized protein YciI